MSINIREKADVSYLFSSLGSGAASVASSNFLSDYASIKNGSYGKLMKAYYNETASDEVKSLAKDKTTTDTLTKEESKNYAKVETTTDELKESADALLEKTLFVQKDTTVTDDNGVETTVKAYDTEAIYSAVNSFVSDYNSVLKAAEETDNSTLTRRVTNMQNTTTSNSKALAKVGITVNEDGTLGIDKDVFKAADMSRVKTLFNGSGSYGYQVSAQASLINYAANNVINKGTTYTSGGNYSASSSTGNLFSSYI